MYSTNRIFLIKARYQWNQEKKERRGTRLSSRNDGLAQHVSLDNFFWVRCLPNTENITPEYLSMAFDLILQITN
jgi:hypothetical protein